MTKKKTSNTQVARPARASAKPVATAASDAGATGDGLRPAHLLLLAVMATATAAALIAHGTELANILFIMLAMVAAGLTAMAVYRTLIPLAADVAIAEPEMLGGRTRAALEREKTIVLRAIKELEFDRAMGKVSDADCEEMVGRLRARAVRLIRQLDSGTAAYRELIERELDARLGRKRMPSPVVEAESVPAGAAGGGGAQ